ncbi:MAG: ABC transporter ATP-binding protein, partial [Candidatus Omnitrophota bacterium]
MKTPVLQLDNVSKTFYPPLSFRDIIRFNFKNKPPAQALDNVSFQLEEGKVLGILGPNGAGKTTLLKIISTLILPDSGKVRVNSYEVNRDDDNIKRSLGLASSEERSFYWRLTGIQNLEFFAAMYGLNKNQARARIKELFETFHINYGRKRFDTYSAGMKRIFLI